MNAHRPILTSNFSKSLSKSWRRLYYVFSDPCENLYAKTDCPLNKTKLSSSPQSLSYIVRTQHATHSMIMTAREDALAHVLHIFSSSSTTSPLIKRDDGSVCLVESDVQQPPRLICNVQMRSGSDWMNQIVLQLQISSTAADTNVEVVMKSMLDMSVIDSVEDDIIWAAGLKLIHCITSQDIFYNMSNETIEPHILMSTLMDSYYHGDEDYQIDERNSNTRQLSVPQAMFQLRSVLATIAIEHAVDRTRKAIERSTTVRWKRLRSMIDDAISLFRKMLLNQLEKACESGSTNESQDVIAMAVYIFVNSMFPPCRDLLQLLLENAKDTQFTMRILQTSYSCIGMLTSLASLQFIFGDGELISYKVHKDQFKSLLVAPTVRQKLVK